MHYFEGLMGKDKVVWKETMDSIKLEGEYPLLANLLVLLYDHAWDAKICSKKGFKIGHMMVTSKQSELILEKGMRSITNNLAVKKNDWRIPSVWDVENPEGDLEDDWNRKDDSRLIIGASKFGRNLKKIIVLYPTMKEKMVDKEGNVL